MKNLDKTPAIETHDLTVSYHQKPVLWGVDLTFPSGGVNAIIGPNGGGKTTLLKTIMGLKKQDSGSVKFFGKPLDSIRKSIAYVPQRQAVDWQFPALVKDVVMMGRYIHTGPFGRTKDTDRHAVAQALEQVGMTRLAERQISELSGGQQQRVFIARALAQEADLYLMDEPFVGVDTTTEELLWQLFRTYASQGKTIIMVHHSLEAVGQHCDRIALLNVYLRASGLAGEVLTPQLLKETYGSDPTVLAEIKTLLEKKGFPPREKP